MNRIEAIPYSRPLALASGYVSDTEHVLIRIHTDEGIIGVADLPPRPYTYGETPQSALAVVEKIFAPAIIDLDPLERGKIGTATRRSLGTPVARSGPMSQCLTWAARTNSTKFCKHSPSIPT